jgi:leucyl aminopeptidase
MQTMRCDMGGAATALGTLATAAELKVPIAIDAIVGLVENMNSGSAYKLGDILAYKNGVTVEIHNTDAEGRLVLADCLIRASEIDGATDVLDLATLTGAVVVAIGPDFTGIFTADDALSAELATAAAQAGEGLWRLPLHDGYKPMLKGDWGQIKNITGKPDAGASTAALFLQHFVKDKRWAHLDIAGSAFADRTSGPYFAGGTGQMTRTLLNWLTTRAG